MFPGNSGSALTKILAENTISVIFAYLILSTWILNDQEDAIQNYVWNFIKVNDTAIEIFEQKVILGINEFFRSNHELLPLALLVILTGLYMIYQKAMLMKTRGIQSNKLIDNDGNYLPDLYYDCDESMRSSLPEPDEVETDYESDGDEEESQGGGGGSAPAKVIFQLEPSSEESDCESDFISDSYRVHNSLNLTQARAISFKCVILEVRDKFSGLRRPFPVRVVIVDEDMSVELDAIIEPGRRLEFVDAPPNFRIMGLPYRLVRQEILNILRGSIIVGYELRQDLKAFEITNEISAASFRDSGIAKMFMTRKAPPEAGWQHPSLRQLVSTHLNLEMRDCLDTVECAKAAMAIYKKYRHLAPSGWARREQRIPQFPALHISRY